MWLFLSAQVCVYVVALYIGFRVESSFFASSIPIAFALGVLGEIEVLEHDNQILAAVRSALRSGRVSGWIMFLSGSIAAILGVAATMATLWIGFRFESLTVLLIAFAVIFAAVIASHLLALRIVASLAKEKSTDSVD